MEKQGKEMRKDVKERIILRFNIPPLQNHCMSSCNFPKMWILLSYCIFSDTSARTSNFLLFLFFEVTPILAFFIRSLYLRLMTILVKLLFFLFNFLFFLYHSPRCRILLSWIALSNLLIVPSRFHFLSWYVCSISLTHRFHVWESQLEVLLDWQRVLDWQRILDPLRHFFSPAILYSHIYFATMGICRAAFEILFMRFLRTTCRWNIIRRWYWGFFF